MDTQTAPATKPPTMRKACAHCGIPTEVSEDTARAFCCSGCMGAYALIHEMGLDDYYALRRNAHPTTGAVTGLKAELLENPAAGGIEVKELPGGFQCVRLAVDGIHCAACSWLIEKMQPNIQGLYSARVRMSDNSIELVYKQDETSLSRIAKRLAPLGYDLSPWREDADLDQEVTQRQRKHWSGIALAAFFAANSMWIGVSLYAGEATGISEENEYFLRWMGAILGLLAAIFPGRVFFQTAWQSIRQRSPHVDIPVAISLTIGTLGSIYGAATSQGHIYFDSLASLILLLLIGRYIQFRAQISARKSIGKLLRWNIPIAKVVESDGRLTATPSDRLQPGQRVQIDAGGIFPADGILESEGTEVDSSLLTGESLPTEIERGDVVIGGTTNLSSTVVVRVTAAGEKSRVGKLLSLVKEATTYKTPWIQLADHVGKWFVIIVLSIACLTWAGWTLTHNAGIATQHTMALLTIACPCALALAAPLVITIALGRAAKKRIWIRDGSTLERLARPGFLWLDKTGTLTTGQIKVHTWLGDEKWIPYAAAAEATVQHPIARAICQFAMETPAPSTPHPLQAIGTQQITGRGTVSQVDGVSIQIGNLHWITELGVELDHSLIAQSQAFLSEGYSTVYVAADNRLVGALAVGDELRSETPQTLMALQKLGWNFGIISGDNSEAVRLTAAKLERHGIHWTEVLGDQTPEAKREVVRSSVAKARLEKSPCPIVMVGDGVNDAAALAEADVGISIRGNSEQSLAIAPVFLASASIGSVAELVHASQEVVKGIRRCFAISLLYNCITISLAVCGLIHPLIAALFMPLSGVSVLAMALRSRAFLPSPPLFLPSHPRPRDHAT